LFLFFKFYLINNNILIFFFFFKKKKIKKKKKKKKKLKIINYFYRWLDNNKLTTIPTNIGNLKNLGSLYVENIE